MIAALIAVLWMPMDGRLWWSETGPSVTTTAYLDSVIYGDGWASQWLAVDELEAALGFPDNEAFSAARVAILWGE